MCCLNNMIPLRSDVHELFDSFEIGIDIHVCPIFYTLNCIPIQSEPQDSNRVISFSQERAHLSNFHLNLKDIPPALHPLPELLTDHLSQGVYLHCLFPKSRHASHPQKAGLSTVVESPGTPESRDDEELYGPVDSEGHIISRLQQLSFDPAPGNEQEPERTIARRQLNQFKGKKAEIGDGKEAFENYLSIALRGV